MLCYALAGSAGGRELVAAADCVLRSAERFSEAHVRTYVRAYVRTYTHTHFGGAAEPISVRFLICFDDVEFKTGLAFKFPSMGPGLRRRTSMFWYEFTCLSI